MRISLNLASRPYVELGPLYARLRILAIVLAVAAVPLWLLLRAETHRAAEAHSRLAAAESQLHSLETQQRGFESSMREPRNAAVLTQSKYLNQIFQRKAFSWTAVMMDLENVLPAGVQVLNIDPVISKDGHVTIRLRVAGPRQPALLLVRNLEHSRRFLLPRLAGESAETTGQNLGLPANAPFNGVNLDILAEYNPLPPEGNGAGAPVKKRPARAGAAAREREQASLRKAGAR